MWCSPVIRNFRTKKILGSVPAFRVLQHQLLGAIKGRNSQRNKTDFQDRFMYFQ